jgi:RNA polymerase sigma factor (sigma-70 family)
VRVEFDILDTEQILREADEFEQSPSSGGSALDAYFASLQKCPKIAPRQLVELARDYHREVIACRDILDQIPGKVFFLTQVLEKLLDGERLTNFFLAHNEKGTQQASRPTDRFLFFKNLQEKASLKNPRLADWCIRPNLILAWSRDLTDRFAELPQRPWISRIFPSQRQSAADLERWASAVKQLEAISGLRINEFAHHIGQLRPRAEKGDSVFATLVECNLKLVIHIAKKFQNRGLTLEDLVQEGNVGLMKGIERFDPEKGFNLSTYAVCWIKEGIMRALMTQGHVIRFPSALHEMLREIQKLREAAAAGGSPEPGSEDLANQLKTSRGNVEAALSLYQICSLHQPINGSQEETIEQALIGDEGITLDESETLRQAIDQLLDSLAPNEKQVLRLRYGLAKGFTKTVEEVAASLKLTRERVRQIEARAIAKMRADPAIQSEKVRFLAT